MCIAYHCISLHFIAHHFSALVLPHGMCCLICRCEALWVWRTALQASHTLAKKSSGAPQLGQALKIMEAHRMTRRIHRKAHIATHHITSHYTSCAFRADKTQRYSKRMQFVRKTRSKVEVELPKWSLQCYAQCEEHGEWSRQCSPPDLQILLIQICAHAFWFRSDKTLPNSKKSLSLHCHCNVCHFSSECWQMHILRHRYVWLTFCSDRLWRSRHSYLHRHSPHKKARWHKKQLRACPDKKTLKMETMLY